MGINTHVMGIFGCCGVVRGDWDLDVPFEVVRDGLGRPCGGGRFRNMLTVRCIYPIFLETPILALVLLLLPVFPGMIEEASNIFWESGLHLAVLLNVVVGFHLEDGVVKFGLGFFLLLLKNGRGGLGWLSELFVFTSEARKDTSLFNRCDILGFIGFSFSLGILRCIVMVFDGTCNVMEGSYFMVVNVVNNIVVVGLLVGDKSWLRDCGTLLQLDGNFSIVEKGIANPLDGAQRDGDSVRTEAILCDWEGRRRGYESPQDGEGQRNFGGARSELHRKGFIGL